MTSTTDDANTDIWTSLPTILCVHRHRVPTWHMNEVHSQYDDGRANRRGTQTYLARLRRILCLEYYRIRIPAFLYSEKRFLETFSLNVFTRHDTLYIMRKDLVVAYSERVN